MHKKKRILFISSIGSGGAVTSLYSTLCGLDRDRFELFVLFYDANKYIEMFHTIGAKVLVLNDMDPELIKSYYDYRKKQKNISNNNLFLKKIKLFLPQLRLDIKLARHGVKIIRDERIDLVHGNTYFSRGMVLAAIFAHVPQVCHCRNFAIPNKSAKLLARIVSRYLYVSDAIRIHYQQHGIAKNKGEVLYEPIDTTIFQPSMDNVSLRREFLISESTKIITNAGRITPWKGQDWFLEAMEILIVSHPDVKLLIVGEAGNNEEDQHFYIKLQEIAAREKLLNKVIFTGLRDDMPEIMSASDIVVHSALKPEPFGRVIAEAMATNTPVIATSEGGVPEIIKHQENGILVTPGDSIYLADSVSRLIDDAEFSAGLAEKGRRYVKDQFSLSSHVEQLHSLYDLILQDRESKNHC